MIHLILTFLNSEDLMFLSEEVEVVNAKLPGVPYSKPVISSTDPSNRQYEDLVIALSSLSLVEEEFSRVSPIPILTCYEATISRKNLHDTIFFFCGCRLPLWKLLLLSGLQILEGKEVVCPVHRRRHDLSDSAYFRTRAVTFVQRALKEFDKCCLSVVNFQ